MNILSGHLNGWLDAPGGAHLSELLLLEIGEREAAAGRDLPGP